MDQLLQEGNKAGLDEQQGKDALGGILSLLKSKLSGDDFKKIQQVLPEADSLMSETNTRAAGSSGSAGSGLMSSAMGMLGGSSGGGGAQGGGSGNVQNVPELMSTLSKLGIDQKKAMSFMPMVAKYMQQNANVDAGSALGVSSGTTGAGSSGAGGDIAGQAASFMSSFGKK